MQHKPSQRTPRSGFFEVLIVLAGAVLLFFLLIGGAELPLVR